ncbi:MAG: imelysin family protein [Hyphomicrobium sp.]
MSWLFEFAPHLVVGSLALSLWGGVATAATPRSHYALVQATLDGFVLPRFAALRAAADQLPATVTRVCEVGDAAARKNFEQKFHDAVTAYAAIEFLRFGPLVEAGRRESLSFWPDPRGFVPRQLRQLIASNDAEKATAESIARQSAAIEGLPALEILMFDPEHPLGPGADAAYRCRLAQAIAVNVAALAVAVDDGWTKEGGWKDKMLRPGSDNDTYKEPQEAASELVKALLTGLALVADVQIKPRIDGKAPVNGPYAKSKLTADYYRSGVESLKSLYTALDLEAYLDKDTAWIPGWADGAWRAMDSSDGLGGRTAASTRSDPPGLRELFDKITGLRKLVTRDMSAAAGLTVGFNELDGD